MIQLQCTHCSTVLSIDDAFAGGVCRCQHCGTIQTVPTKAQAAQAADGSPQPSPQPLFKRKGRIESALSPYSDDLEKAADQIPSSGMAAGAVTSGVNRRSATDNVPMSSQLPMSSIPMSSQLPMSGTTLSAAETRQRQAEARGQKVHVHAMPGSQPAGNSKRTLVYVAAGALAAVVVGLGLWLTLGRSGRGTDLGISTTPPSREDVATLAAPTPSMAGVELKGDTIGYVIDRSGCSAQVFADMLRACERSTETLGAARKFQLVVLNADRVILYPRSGPQNANTSNRQGLVKAVGDEVYLSASKNTADMISKIVDGKPDAIVLLSANEETTAFSETVVRALGNKPPRVFTFYVGAASSNEGLADLASKTEGEYNTLNLANIK